MAARVSFIGAGPGAADLMTLRGAKALGQAQVVLYDALTDPALRAMAPQAQWIDVGKRGFRHATSQPEINALLLEAARTHERVVRLKGGDPSVLGRLEAELETLLAEGIDCEVIPGITAALAAAADALRPLTRRGSGRSLSLTTAMTQLGTLHATRTADTAACVVSRAGWPDRRISTHTIATLADAGALHADRPAVVTVGAGARALRAASQDH